MYFILNILMTRNKNGLKKYVLTDKWDNVINIGYYDDFTHDGQFLTFYIKGNVSGIVDLYMFEFIFILSDKDYSDMLKRY